MRVHMCRLERMHACVRARLKGMRANGVHVPIIIERACQLGVQTRLLYERAL